jgi:hypothetical protein
LPRDAYGRETQGNFAAGIAIYVVAQTIVAGAACMIHGRGRIAAVVGIADGGNLTATVIGGIIGQFHHQRAVRAGRIQDDGIAGDGIVVKNQLIALHVPDDIFVHHGAALAVQRAAVLNFQTIRAHNPAHAVAGRNLGGKPVPLMVEFIVEGKVQAVIFQIVALMKAGLILAIGRGKHALKLSELPGGIGVFKVKALAMAEMFSLAQAEIFTESLALHLSGAYGPDMMGSRGGVFRQSSGFRRQSLGLHLIEIRFDCDAYHIFLGNWVVG